MLLSRLPKNPGLYLLMEGLVALTRMTGGRVEGRTAAELRGSAGRINLVFEGRGGGAWHLNNTGDAVFMERGAVPDARATLRIGIGDFFELLSGKTSYFVAQMAGKIRVEGEGLALMAFSSLIGSLQANRSKPDREGRFLRAFTGTAMRLSGTGHRFVEDPT